MALPEEQVIMKLIAQFLTILFISVNTLQLILTIGIIMGMMKVLFDKLKMSRSKWATKQRKRSFHNNIWAIE
jgi:hypothetical protein